MLAGGRSRSRLETEIYIDLDYWQAFVQHQERDRKPFLANDAEVDGLVSHHHFISVSYVQFHDLIGIYILPSQMIKAIQVLRIHL